MAVKKITYKDAAIDIIDYNKMFNHAELKRLYNIMPLKEKKLLNAVAYVFFYAVPVHIRKEINKKVLMYYIKQYIKDEGSN